MLRRLVRDTRGVALVEFAICLPVMLTMYLGAFIVSDMISCNRKVSIAASTLAELTSRNLSPAGVSTDPADTSATAYLSDSALVLFPYSRVNATETVSLLRLCSTTQAYVVWSQTQTQGNDGTVASSNVTVGSPTSPTIVTLPANLIVQSADTPGYYPLAPASPATTTNINICNNTSSSDNTFIVGSLGSYFYTATVTYNYTPFVSLGAATTTPMADTIYMSPRLN